MHDTWTRLQELPDSVRAATVGIALIALALCAGLLTAGNGEHRVPVAPILQAETTAGDPVAEPVPETPTNTEVSVTEAGGEGSQSLDVSVESSASAPPSDVSATASVDQSSTSSNQGTHSESTSEHFSSTTSGEGSSSTSVEINKTTSNQVVTTGPDQGNGSNSNVVSHVTSHVGSTAG